MSISFKLVIIQFVFLKFSPVGARVSYERSVFSFFTMRSCFDYLDYSQVHWLRQQEPFNMYFHVRGKIR